MAKTLLVLMPWASPVFPGLGPALLRSVLLREGTDCDICYGNLLFSKLIDSDPFLEANLAGLPIAEVGFTPHYFDPSAPDPAQQLCDFARSAVDDPTEHTLERYEHVVRAAG